MTLHTFIIKNSLFSIQGQVCTWLNGDTEGEDIKYKEGKSPTKIMNDYAGGRQES